MSTQSQENITINNTNCTVTLRWQGKAVEIKVIPWEVYDPDYVGGHGYYYHLIARGFRASLNNKHFFADTPGRAILGVLAEFGVHKASEFYKLDGQPTLPVAA